MRSEIIDSDNMYCVLSINMFRYVHVVYFKSIDSDMNVFYSYYRHSLAATSFYFCYGMKKTWLMQVRNSCLCDKEYLLPWCDSSVPCVETLQGMNI